MPAHKPTLLLIAHTYAIDEHAKKLPALAKYFDLTCVTVTKSSWGKHFGLDVSHAKQIALHRDYELLELDAKGDVNSVTGFVLKGLRQIIASRSWDIILVENEPWSLLKWQTLFCTRLFSRDSIYGEFTWENLLRPGVKGTILSAVYLITARWADFWICGNRAAGDIVRSYGMPDNSVLVSAQVGVDEKHYCPATQDERQLLRKRFNLPEDAVVVGFAGRLVHEKGVQDLLAAIDKVNQLPAYKDRTVHLAFMGHGPLKEEIEKAAHERTWLKLFDPVPHHQLPSFLQCLDILILGSHRVVNGNTCWEEQFGHILIEAIGCGVLTLGSRSGAIPEVLGDDDLLFNPGNVGELGDLLLKYTGNENARKDKLAGLQTRLHEKYTHEAVAKEWAQFLIHKLNATR